MRTVIEVCTSGEGLGDDRQVCETRRLNFESPDVHAACQVCPNIQRLQGRIALECANYTWRIFIGGTGISSYVRRNGNVLGTAARSIRIPVPEIQGEFYGEIGPSPGEIAVAIGEGVEDPKGAGLIWVDSFCSLQTC